MIITTETRAELLASGWAEPVTDPVRLDTLAYGARNLRWHELIAALPDGTAYTTKLDDRHERIEWWSTSLNLDRDVPALSSDLTGWAAEQGGPVRCWTT